MKKTLNTKELLQYTKNISGKTICLDYEEQKWFPLDPVSFRLKFSSIDVYDSINNDGLNIISLKSADKSQLDLHFVTKVSVSKDRFSEDLYIECFQPSCKSTKTYHFEIS